MKTPRHYQCSSNLKSQVSFGTGGGFSFALLCIFSLAEFLGRR